MYRTLHSPCAGFFTLPLLNLQWYKYYYYLHFCLWGCSGANNWLIQGQLTYSRSQRWGKSGLGSTLARVASVLNRHAIPPLRRYLTRITWLSVSLDMLLNFPLQGIMNYLRWLLCFVHNLFSFLKPVCRNLKYIGLNTKWDFCNLFVKSNRQYPLKQITHLSFLFTLPTWGNSSIETKAPGRLSVYEGSFCNIVCNNKNLGEPDSPSLGWREWRLVSRWINLLQWINAIVHRMGCCVAMTWSMVRW